MSNPTMAITRNYYRPVCAYCQADPVNAECVNCGAPQNAAQQGQILTTARVLSAAQIAAVRKHWLDMYS